MRAMIPITEEELQMVSFVPLFPCLILEDEGYVLAYVPDWMKRMPRSRLEDVTAVDVAEVLQLPETETVRLSEILELPSDDLYEPKLIGWIQDWRARTVAEMRAERRSSRQKTERVA